KVLMPAAMPYKQSHYSIPSKNINLMPASAEPAEMKKKPAQKNVSFHIGMSSGNGIQKTNALNFGICSTEKKPWESISAYSRSVTGQKWMYGNTSYRKRLISLLFILHTNANALSV